MTHRGHFATDHTTQPHAHSCSARGCEVRQRGEGARAFLPSSTLAPGRVTAVGARRQERCCWCEVVLAQRHSSSNPKGWRSPSLGPAPNLVQEALSLGPSCCQLFPWTTAGRAPCLGWRPAPNLGAHGHVPVWHHHRACRRSAEHRVGNRHVSCCHSRVCTSRFLQAVLPNCVGSCAGLRNSCYRPSTKHLYRVLASAHA